MENENITEVESEEVEVEVDDSAFDEGWDDEPVKVEEGTDDLEGADETEEPEAEETEGEPEQTEEAEPETKPEADNQRFQLKYNGEDFDVSREEVIELAQKGKDYDRVKSEYDKIKADAGTMNRLKNQEAFLKELAEQSEMTVEELIESTRARMLMANDDSLTEEEALKQVRSKANKEAEKKEPEQAKEPTPEERRQKMFATFLSTYPDVKAEEIPKEVWDDAGRTFDLVGAYMRHQNRELLKEIETLRQNNKNKERSTGSRKSIGASKPKDDFDEGWDSLD
jgi:hypothetical protein